MAYAAILLVAGSQESLNISLDRCEIEVACLPNPAYIPEERPETACERKLQESQALVLNASGGNAPLNDTQNGVSSRMEPYIRRASLKRRPRGHVHLAQVNTVEKRNARERTRVNTVNQAFLFLKRLLPPLRANTKRVSKLKILRATINYIRSLDKDAGVVASCPAPNNPTAEENAETTQPMLQPIQTARTDDVQGQSGLRLPQPTSFYADQNNFAIAALSFIDPLLRGSS